MAKRRRTSKRKLRARVAVKGDPFKAIAGLFAKGAAARRKDRER